MELYIRMNTEFRKQAKSNFHTDFYELKNNSVLEKTTKNLRKHENAKIVRSWEGDKIRQLVANPSFARYDIFGIDLAGIHMHKTKLFLNKPMYTGMTILENSKLLMYDMFYGHLKAKYGPRCELIYTDTDSLLFDIPTEDIYEDMAEDIHLYDKSNYPKEHLLYSGTNKKVLEKMKDECKGRALGEVVALRPKMYTVQQAKKISGKPRV